MFVFIPSDNLERKWCTNDQIIVRSLRKRYFLYGVLIVCTRLKDHMQSLMFEKVNICIWQPLHLPHITVLSPEVTWAQSNKNADMGGGYKEIDTLHGTLKKMSCSWEY